MTQPAEPEVLPDTGQPVPEQPAEPVAEPAPAGDEPAPPGEGDEPAAPEPEPLGPEDEPPGEGEAEPAAAPAEEVEQVQPASPEEAGIAPHPVGPGQEGTDLVTELRTGGSTSNESIGLPATVQAGAARAHALMGMLLEVADDVEADPAERLAHVRAVADMARAELERYLPDTLRHPAAVEARALLSRSGL